MNRSKKNPLSCGVFFLIFCSFLLSTAVTAGALERVPWSRLAYHLESRQVKLLDLPTCDCPLGINEDAPSHQVIQVIGNTFYEWREYTFTNSKGETRLAIEMLQPESRYLTAKEARILLTASAGWQQVQVREKHPPLSQTKSQPTPQSKTRMPVTDAQNSTLRAASIVPDNRIRVTPDLVTQFPFQTITALSILDQGTYYRGTGFLISPYCVLTAGHNVWWVDHWSTEINVIPAQYSLDGSVIAPFGEQLGVGVRTNIYFGQVDDPDDYPDNEFDYGAIILNQPFPQLDTFMPIEVQDAEVPLPDTLNIAGYPATVAASPETTHDMWFMAGPPSLNYPCGDKNQLVYYDIFVSGGNSGSPIFYITENGQKRVIGIATTVKIDQGGAGVLFTRLNIDLILSWLTYTPDEDLDYQYTYYVPYFSTDASWTGLALTNPNPDDTNHVKIDYFSPDGVAGGSQHTDLPHNGQNAISCTPADITSGWIRVSSTLPLYGLALIGSSTPSTMFDMDLKDSLHKKLIFPHLAVDNFWDSRIMICNPGDTPADLFPQYRDKTGSYYRPIDVSDLTVPAHGSRVLNLGQIYDCDLQGGSLILESNQPVTAFLLYDGTKTGKENWKAGLSAVPLD